MRWLVLVVAGLLAGCTTTRYVTREVPVEVERVTVERRTDVVRDTTVMHDSVFVAVRGDTVLVERWRERERVRWQAVTDTVHDTVPRVVTVEVEKPVPIVKTVEVEKPVPWWRRGLEWAGGIALALVGMAAVWKIKIR